MLAVEEALARQWASGFAEGEVIGHRQATRAHAGVFHAPRIRFITAEGRTVIAEPAIWSRIPTPVTGSPVALRYRRDRPEIAEPHRPWLTWLRPAAAVALPILLAGTGLAMLLRRRHRANPPGRA